MHGFKVISVKGRQLLLLMWSIFIICARDGQYDVFHILALIYPIANFAQGRRKSSATSEAWDKNGDLFGGTSILTGKVSEGIHRCNDDK